jgi:hypothetical protein
MANCSNDQCGAISGAIITALITRSKVATRRPEIPESRLFVFDIQTAFRARMSNDNMSLSIFRFFTSGISGSGGESESSPCATANLSARQCQCKCLLTLGEPPALGRLIGVITFVRDHAAFLPRVHATDGRIYLIIGTRNLKQSTRFRS